MGLGVLLNFLTTLLVGQLFDTNALAAVSLASMVTLHAALCCPGPAPAQARI